MHFCGVELMQLILAVGAIKHLTDAARLWWNEPQRKRRREWNRRWTRR